MGLRDLLNPRPDPRLGRIESKVEQLAEALHNLCHDLERHHNVTVQSVERNSSRIMATIQEFRDALNEQNQAILQEVQEINNKLAQAGNIPQDVLDTVRSHTQQIRDIVNEPLPEPQPPGPEPEPPAGGRRR